MSKEEVSPPWVMYPGYPPGDGFWRQSGEAWFHYVWLPFWESLSPQAQGKYLEKWAVPDSWRAYYFDPNFQKWLESVDD